MRRIMTIVSNAAAAMHLIVSHLEVDAAICHQWVALAMPKGSDEDLGRGNDAGRPREKMSDETIEGRDVTQKQLKALQMEETVAMKDWLRTKTAAFGSMK